jgi:hypothetical protein
VRKLIAIAALVMLAVGVSGEAAAYSGQRFRHSWSNGRYHHHAFRHHAYKHRRYVHRPYTHHHRTPHYGQKRRAMW